MTNIFTGKIFKQQEDVLLQYGAKSLEYKRINKSIQSQVGWCTEKFIKYYFDNTCFFNQVKEQKWISLEADEFLLRDNIILNGEIFDCLQIHKFENFKQFNEIIIKTNPRDFLKIIFKDYLGFKLKDFKKDKSFNLESFVLANFFSKFKYFENLIIKDERIILIFNKKIDLFYEQDFFKIIGVISNREARIRADFIIHDIKKNKDFFIEVKSRLKSKLQRKDIYSSIYYPIYFNQKNPNFKKDMLLIYYGELDDGVAEDIKDIQRRYKKYSNASLKVVDFNKMISELKNKYNNPDLLGFEITGFKNNNSEQYIKKKLWGIFDCSPSFKLDYVYNFEKQIEKVKNKSELQKEITRDSKRRL